MQRAASLHMGQVDRERAEVEARAKVFWGDDRKEVIKFLMMNGHDVHEATALVQEMRKERASSIQSKGIRKTFTGIGMMCVPVVYFGACLMIGYISLMLLGLTGAVALWGAWRTLDGLLMFFNPGSETGDVADK